MTDQERITELEIRFSHQDHFLKELNSVVVSQQLTIEQLQKAVLDLKRSLNQETISATRTLQDDKPPHY